jgi:hypothetical protein
MKKQDFSYLPSLRACVVDDQDIVPGGPPGETEIALD